jgi:hypothetical protein
MTKNDLENLLSEDRKNGEGWHVEFKGYTDAGLLIEKTASDWKSDLGKEMTAFASTGGRIYIGVADNGDIQGLTGKEQDWLDNLVKRSLGGIKPKPTWKSYLVNVENRKVMLIDLSVGEPIYFYNDIPYIREGTETRKATPEDVKKRHAIIEKEQNKQSELVNEITEIVIYTLISLNQYQQKDIRPRKQTMEFHLEAVRGGIENKLGDIKRIFGHDNDFFILNETISKEILAATSVRLVMDGGVSHKEWRLHLKNVYDATEKLLEHIRTTVKVQIDGLDELKEDTRNKTIRWLESIDDTLQKFINEADTVVHSLLRLYILLKLNGENNEKYKSIADEIERLSWATANTDYMEIADNIPALKSRLLLINLTVEQAELLTDANLDSGKIYKLKVDAIPNGFIRIGAKTYGNEETPREIAKYVHALEELIELGYVTHTSGQLYSMTSAAFELF